MPSLVVDEALHRGDRALEREDHLVHRDVLRRAGEDVAAVGAAGGLDEAGLLQQRHDALEVGEREVLRRRDRLERHRAGGCPCRPSWISSRTPYSAFVVKIIER